MKYDKKFGFYDPKTGKAIVFDGRKRKESGNVVPKIFEGYCSKEAFNLLLKDNSIRA